MLEGCRRGGVTSVGAVASMLGAIMLASIVCTGADSRPPLANDCNDAACIDARDNGIPRQLPSSDPGDGSGGAAGGGGMPQSGAATLGGTVQEIISQDLSSSRSLQGSVEVRAPSATPMADDVVVSTGAGGSFRLEGMQQATTTWVGVGRFDDPPSDPFIDTLQAVDSTSSSALALLVLRRDLIQELATAAFTSNPVEIAPLGAHVVIRFVGEDRLPVRGVQITFPAPELVSTAYDNGDTYSDSLQATSERGMAILLNLAAAPFPGGTTSIVAEIDGQRFTTQLHTAESSVTVVNAIVPMP